MEDFLIKFFPDIYQTDQIRAQTGQNNNPYCKYVTSWLLQSGMLSLYGQCGQMQLAQMQCVAAPLQCAII